MWVLSARTEICLRFAIFSIQSLGFYALKQLFRDLQLNCSHQKQSFQPTCTKYRLVSRSPAHQQLFATVTQNNAHPLQQLFPPRKRYSTRARPHNYQLLRKTSLLDIMYLCCGVTFYLLFANSNCFNSGLSVFQ